MGANFVAGYFAGIAGCVQLGARIPLRMFIWRARAAAVWEAPPA
jgi:hypothetical protein